MQNLREAAAASKTAAEQSQVKAASLQQQLAASEEHIQGLAQQLEQLQAVLSGQESESAASSEQLSRQVAQLLAAQQELQQANARLLEAEAEYASNQLSLGCRNQELNKQLQVRLAACRCVAECKVVTAWSFLQPIDCAQGVGHCTGHTTRLLHNLLRGVRSFLHEFTTFCGLLDLTLIHTVWLLAGCCCQQQAPGRDQPSTAGTER
jgi:hypothetical protein